MRFPKKKKIPEAKKKKKFQKFQKFQYAETQQAKPLRTEEEYVQVNEPIQDWLDSEDFEDFEFGYFVEECAEEFVEECVFLLDSGVEFQ